MSQNSDGDKSFNTASGEIGEIEEAPVPFLIYNANSKGKQNTPNSNQSFTIIK